MTEIKLGNKVKDIVTGFEGIAVERLEYLNGTITIGVRAPHSKNDGHRPKVEYIGLEQLERTGEGIHVKPHKRQLGFVAHDRN